MSDKTFVLIMTSLILVMLSFIILTGSLVFLALKENNELKISSEEWSKCSSLALDVDKSKCQEDLIKRATKQ